MKTKKKTGKDYILGVNKTELERLKFQHDVWKPVTDSFFDRLNIQKGWKCLDVGAGPGFVSMDLRERIGAKGKMTALEPSGMYLKYFKSEVKKRNWKNFEYLKGHLEDIPLKKNYYNLIYVRWVITFVPEPDKFLEKLVDALAPGGIVALQDYAYDTLLLYPTGGAFDIAPEVVKNYYIAGGGDPYIGARLPSLFKKNGLELIDYKPNCLAGGPESGVFQWGDKFFTGHIRNMVDKKVINKKTGDKMLADWINHRENPDSIFFSRIVVDAAGRKMSV